MILEGIEASNKELVKTLESFTFAELSQQSKELQEESKDDLIIQETLEVIKNKKPELVENFFSNSFVGPEQKKSITINLLSKENFPKIIGLNTATGDDNEGSNNSNCQADKHLVTENSGENEMLNESDESSTTELVTKNEELNTVFFYYGIKYKTKCIYLLLIYLFY